MKLFLQRLREIASALGLKMDNASFRVVCGLRLGLPLCRSYTCRCGEIVDEYGRHGLSCKLARGRIPRHSQVNDLFSRALGSALIPNCREPDGLVSGDMGRPDGMTLVPWSKESIWYGISHATIHWHPHTSPQHQ